MGAAGRAPSSLVLSPRAPDQRSSSSPPPSRLLSYISCATPHSWTIVAEAPGECNVNCWVSRH
uniref:Uncharacterized protein n=1 Tax=Triticum urartu TaxID=4572 RepID=A0A8R7PDV3_TRIUA